MPTSRLLVRFLAVLLLASGCAPAGAEDLGENAPGEGGRELKPAWQAWTDAVWTRARAERRLVLLEIGARWCHWCQVMDHTTYRDAAVLGLLADHFIAVHVDQAERPDLASRYEDFGWPATVIFGTDGTELVRWRGYLPPAQMRALLAAVVADPTPGPSVQALAPAAGSAASASLPEALAAQLRRAFADAYDPRLGGWGRSDKALDGACILAAWRAGDRGDGAAADMASTTLAAARALIDPVWGGVCQYSVSDWSHLHYEKIAQVQADVLRTYALAHARGVAGAGDDARRILGFVRTFLLSPDGGAYASQDADVEPGQESSSYYLLDAQRRRARGMPGIDQHRFAREAGWLAEALAVAGACLCDERALDEAAALAQWAIRERALPLGGFRHDVGLSGGPYLGDSLAMGQACLRLAQISGDPTWLGFAEGARRFIDAQFADEGGGYRTAARAGGLPVAPERDENAALARWARQLWAATGLREDRACAERAARWCLSPARAVEPSAAPMLLVDDDLVQPRSRVLVIGAPHDRAAEAQVAQALACSAERDAVVRWDGRDADAPAMDHLPVHPAPGLYLAEGGRWVGPCAAIPGVRAGASAPASR